MATHQPGKCGSVGERVRARFHSRPWFSFPLTSGSVAFSGISTVGKFCGVCGVITSAQLTRTLSVFGSNKTAVACNDDPASDQ